MRCIILILVLIPYLSWSMDDNAFSSVSSDDMVCEESYHSLDLDDQNDSPDQPVSITTSPRSTRSDSYVQTFHNVLRRSQEIRVDGLGELEAGVGVVATPRSLLTQDQIAEYFFTSMEGQNVPGIGVFDRKDKGQCESLRGLIGVIKRVDPKRYDSMVKSITHHRSRRYPNAALIEVLGKVVTSINSLNEESNKVAKAQYDAAILQLSITQDRLETEQGLLEQAKLANSNATRRYRMGMIWTIAGGALAVVATNVIQAVVTKINSDMDMAHMCQQMQNTTMS